MKTLTIFFSTIVITLFVIQVNGQPKPDTYKPNWFISKEVQKVSNRNWLQNQNAFLVKSIGTPREVISKSVNRLPKTRDDKGVAENNISSTGYPIWIVSKGVARIDK